MSDAAVVTIDKRFEQMMAMLNPQRLVQVMLLPSDNQFLFPLPTLEPGANLLPAIPTPVPTPLPTPEPTPETSP